MDVFWVNVLDILKTCLEDISVQVCARWDHRNIRVADNEPYSHTVYIMTVSIYIDGLVQDCSSSIANALELLQSCTKPSYIVK